MTCEGSSWADAWRGSACERLLVEWLEYWQDDDTLPATLPNALLTRTITHLVVNGYNYPVGGARDRVPLLVMNSRELAVVTGYRNLLMSTVSDLGPRDGFEAYALVHGCLTGCVKDLDAGIQNYVERSS